MSTNTKVNAELELRPLEDHALDIVSGGQNPLLTIRSYFDPGGTIYHLDGPWDPYNRVYGEKVGLTPAHP